MWPSVGDKQGWNARIVRPNPSTKRARARKPGRSGAGLDNRRTMEAEITNRAVEFIKRNAKRRQAVLCLRCLLARFTCRRCRIRSSLAKPATGIGPIAWPKWITAPARSSTPSRKPASKTTPWSSSPATMARRRPTPGKGTAGRGAAPISRRWKLAPCAVHHPLAGQSAGGPRQQRNRSYRGHVPDLARVGGAEVPKDRPIDGVDQLDFFLGKQENSNREGFPAYVADRLSAVKWRNWKMHLIWQENMYDPPQQLPLPKVTISSAT